MQKETQKISSDEKEQFEFLLHEKDKEIVKLKEDCENFNIKIAELEGIIESLNKQVKDAEIQNSNTERNEYLTSQIKISNKKIKSQNEMINKLKEDIVMLQKG